MPLFPWDDSYEIGMTEIDRQHRQLVDIINELETYDIKVQVNEATAVKEDALKKLDNVKRDHQRRLDELQGVQVRK